MSICVKTMDRNTHTRAHRYRDTPSCVLTVHVICDLMLAMHTILLITLLGPDLCPSFYLSLYFAALILSIFCIFQLFFFLSLWNTFFISSLTLFVSYTNFLLFSLQSWIASIQFIDLWIDGKGVCLVAAMTFYVVCVSVCDLTLRCYQTACSCWFSE